MRVNELSCEKIGIIDGVSNLDVEGVNFSESNRSKSSNSSTHGDYMIRFVKQINPNINIYYFDATDNDGKISLNKILEGLEWMKANNISRVNMSLSTTSNEEELQKWISRNQEEITIYASYNNLVNSLDYPAMYKGVIASGCDDRRVTYKSTDKCYYNNNVVLSNDLFNVYRGNSYLSLLTLLQDGSK